MKGKNFEVVTVACESKGAKAALPFVQAAHQQHPSLLDERHLLPELYNTKNVPA
ncbi:MAG: TlpA family protein disulfide reductase, partial [Chloroflexi bacterium]|nr:TlpA family protein disulfide reductase [Chloroflexota bacterium]